MQAVQASTQHRLPPGQAAPTWLLLCILFQSRRALASQRRLAGALLALALAGRRLAALLLVCVVGFARGLVLGCLLALASLHLAVGCGGAAAAGAAAPLGLLLRLLLGRPRRPALAAATLLGWWLGAGGAAALAASLWRRRLGRRLAARLGAALLLGTSRIRGGRGAGGAARSARRSLPGSLLLACLLRRLPPRPLACHVVEPRRCCSGHPHCAIAWCLRAWAAGGALREHLALAVDWQGRPRRSSDRWEGQEGVGQPRASCKLVKQMLGMWPLAAAGPLPSWCARVIELQHESQGAALPALSRAENHGLLTMQQK